MANKDLAYYMNLDYPIHYIEADGGFVAKIPLLRGCTTYGDTFEEVRELIQDAKRGWLESQLEGNQVIPEPEKVNA
jgi:antitoxin HicB